MISRSCYKWFFGLSIIIYAYDELIVYAFHFLICRRHRVIMENRKVAIWLNEAAHFGNWVFLCQGSKSIHTIWQLFDLTVDFDYNAITKLMCFLCSLLCDMFEFCLIDSALSGTYVAHDCNDFAFFWHVFIHQFVFWRFKFLFHLK
jgi:hypothetical protein